MKQLKRAFWFVRGFLPSRLPLTRDELITFCDRIIFVYGLPDFPSYKQLIATLIMHVEQKTVYKSYRYFAVACKRAMANEIAYQVIQDLKKEEAAKAAEKHKTKSEVIPINKGTTSEAQQITV